MRQYNPQVQYAMPQDDGATEKEIAATNDIVQTIAKPVEGYLQQKVDQQQTAQGAKDAAKEGDKFTPASNLTAAGRAYNKGAQPIEMTNIGSTLQNSMEQQYLASKEQPLNQDALNNFNQQSSKNNEAYIDSLPTNYRSYATEISNRIQQSYGMRLSNDIANNYIASDSQKKITAIQQGINTSAQLRNNAAQISDPKKQQEAFQDSSTQYFHNIQTANTIANPKLRSASLINIKQNAISSIITSTHQKLVNMVNRTPANSSQRTALIAQLDSYSTNFLKNKDVSQQLMSLGLMDDKGIVNSMSQGLYLRLQHNLAAENKSYLAGSAATRENNQYMISNAIAAAKDGKTASFENISLMNTKQLNQYHGNLYANAKFNDAKQGGLKDIINLQGKIRSNELGGDFQNLSEVEKQNVTSSLSAQTNNYIQLSNKDPAQLLQGDSSIANNDKLISNRLTGDDQKQFKNYLSNPALLWTKRLSPNAAQAVQDDLNYKISRQRQHGLKTEIINNSQALAYKNSLMTMPNIQQAKALQIYRLNTGAAWGSIESSLLKQKYPFSNIVASKILDKDPNLANDIIEGGNYLKDKDAVQEYVNSKSLFGTTKQQILLNSDFQKTLQAIAPGTSEAAIAKRTGYENAIFGLAIERFKNGQPSNISDINKEVYKNLFQNDSSDTFSVPYYYTGHNGARIPIDLQTVKNKMAYLKSPEAILNEASFAGQKDDIYSHEIYKNSVSNGHWVNAPNGNGFNLKDMYGRSVKFKDGSPYSFTFDATQSHNFNKNYIKFINERGLF